MTLVDLLDRLLGDVLLAGRRLRVVEGLLDGLFLPQQTVPLRQQALPAGVRRRHVHGLAQLGLLPLLPSRVDLLLQLLQLGLRRGRQVARVPIRCRASRAALMSPLATTTLSMSMAANVAGWRIALPTSSTAGLRVSKSIAHCQSRAASSGWPNLATASPRHSRVQQSRVSTFGASGTRADGSCGAGSIALDDRLVAVALGDAVVERQARTEQRRGLLRPAGVQGQLARQEVQPQRESDALGQQRPARLAQPEPLELRWALSMAAAAANQPAASAAWPCCWAITPR